MNENKMKYNFFFFFLEGKNRKSTKLNKILFFFQESRLRLGKSNLFGKATLLTRSGKFLLIVLFYAHL